MSEMKTNRAASLRRSRSTDRMWSNIDPLMHKRFEEAMDRKRKQAE